jgi:hypothetical protein
LLQTDWHVLAQKSEILALQVALLGALMNVSNGTVPRKYQQIQGTSPPVICVSRFASPVVVIRASGEWITLNGEKISSRMNTRHHGRSVSCPLAPVTWLHDHYHDHRRFPRSRHAMTL